jgi:ribulose-5-phosphate 4-epimerase/fuculose-1-phosphate aldolase
VDRPATLTENEGVSSIFTGKNAPDEIIPFSAGRWLAQAYRSPACATRGCPAGTTGAFVRCKKPARGQNAFGCDVNGRLKLNHINGRAPVTGTGARAVLGASFPSAFVRTMYDVVRGTGTIPSYLRPFFGPKGAFCGSRYRSVITSYGFVPTLGCGMPPWIIRTVAGSGPHGYNGDRIPAGRAELHLPVGLAMDGTGNLVLTDAGNNRVRVVAASTGTFYGQAMTSGDIYTVAGNGQFGYNGDGIPATSAGLRAGEVAVDHAGNLVVTDDNDRVRVVAVRTGTFYGQDMTAGDIYTVAGNGHSGYNGDGIPATSATLVPDSVTVDGAGNLVITDDGNYRVRVVAASTGTFYGQAMTAGDIYTIAGTGDNIFNGDGIPATSAGISPDGVTMDSAGNLVVTDGSRVRVVAVRTGTFYGQPMTAGDIYTVVGDGTWGSAGDGGPARSAELSDAHDVAVDHAGNLVITDTPNNRVRVVAARSGTFYGIAMTKGDIYTVGGDGPSGWNGDGIPATTAQFSSPLGVAVTRAGDLLICDAISNRVRVISPP